MSRVAHICPHCGVELVKPRSLADHRRYFAAIHKATAAWPHNHEFQPSGPDHLRAYLLVTAGYHDVKTVDLAWAIAEDNPHLIQLARLAVEASVSAALSRGDYVFTRPRGDVVEILSPKSINFRTLSQKEFGPIREACEEIIELAIGTTVDQLLRQEAA